MRPRDLVIAIVLVFASTAARAQPWAQGVSEPRKAAAQKLLEQGNALFLAQDYKAALTKYEEAIASWDHPAIRFNVVRCMIQLDRPVEASENLVAALKYGADALDDKVYQEALLYRKLLAKQVAEIEIHCSHVGAKVTLDGGALMTCPGTEKRRVTPGKHGIVASKDGYLPQQIELVVVGGNQERANIELIPLAKAARIEHRWSRWIPWVVVAGGVAVGGAGAMLEVVAKNALDDYDRDIARECPNGCTDEVLQQNGWTRNKQSALRLDTYGVAVMSVGVSTLVVGGVLLYMNRGRTVYERPATERAPQARLDVVPAVGGATVLVETSF